ncbi:MAG: hypothetical protein U0Q18_03495 [Bryobacteraceae bacterium]
MRRVSIALFVLAVTALAASLKLYLKDGSYQVVSEYHVQSDRVRFYSVERSQWEEIPLDLVDVKRTESELAEKKASLAEEAKVISEEDKAVRALQEDIARIPQNPGVYYLENNTAKAIKVAESKVHNNKGRNVLKAVSPIPIVTGKATLELDNAHSPNILNNPEQEFYIQLSDEERFGIIKLTPERGVRIVEKLTTIPVTKQVVEEPVDVEIFRKQLTQNGLYKIWPAKPLEAGEYAVVEYTPGKMNMQIWDFAIKPGK